MQSDKKLSIAESREIQLNMLKEFDSFCRSKGLRYSLAYGTLLGAIRHKGFIPWDDDMDIIMPQPDLEVLKKELKSDTIKYLDIDTYPLYDFSFPRICDPSTYNQIGRVKSYGLNFDLYPVVGCSNEKDEIEAFLNKGTKKRNRLLQFQRIRNGLSRRFPIKTIPFFGSLVRSVRDYACSYPYSYSNVYYHHGGPFKWYEIFFFDVFDPLIEVEFEGSKFLATGRYDDYLTQIYGDYMTPPPEDKRVFYHGGHYYKK